jgi:hypothetical protein
MPISSKYLFVVNMDVDADKEALFNEVYDTEHIPNLLKVPGVRAVTRMAGEHFALSIGGAEKKVAHDGPRYSAIYEIDGPHVLVSPGGRRRSKKAAGRARSGPSRTIGGMPFTRCASTLRTKAVVTQNCREGRADGESSGSRGG